MRNGNSRSSGPGEQSEMGQAQRHTAGSHSRVESGNLEPEAEDRMWMQGAGKQVGHRGGSGEVLVKGVRSREFKRSTARHGDRSHHMAGCTWKWEMFSVLTTKN